jgi:P27 family predicted phage terminase small subunit
MAGPSPTPTALQVAGGNPGKRAINRNEPAPKLLNDLDPPMEFLAGELAAKVWTYLAPKLRAAFLLTEIDVIPLCRYCNAAAEALAGQKKVSELMEAEQWGQLVNAKSGNYHPAMQVRNKALAEMASIEPQFGMTPSARTRISVDRQMALDFGDKPDQADAPKENPAVSKLDALREKLGLVAA